MMARIFHVPQKSAAEDLREKVEDQSSRRTPRSRRKQQAMLIAEEEAEYGRTRKGKRRERAS
jgi:hypothetical protein